MMNSLFQKILIAFILAYLLCLSPAFAQQTYETTSANTSDGLLWSSTVTWDVGSAPGSGNSGVGGLATDNVIFSHHESGGGTQTYRVGTNVGSINNLEINGGTATGNGGNGDAVRLELRDGGDLTVTGTTTLGANEQASIVLNSGTTNLKLEGDIEIAAGATGQGLTSYIEHTLNNSSLLVIGGNINGQLGSGGLDLRINGNNNGSANVIFNTTGGTTTDTNAQTLNLDVFGVGNSGNNFDAGIFTLGSGKTVNALDINVGYNFSSSTTNRNVTGDLTVEDTTITASDDVFIGRNATSSGLNSQIRRGTGTISINAGATLSVGDDLILGGGTGQSSSTDQRAVGTLNINGGGTVSVNDNVDLGSDAFGTGTINVNNGTLTTFEGALNIGGNSSSVNADAGATGEVNVGGSGIVTIGNNGSEQHIFIGRNGLGTMNSAGTVKVTKGDVRLGDSAGANGEANALNVTGGTFEIGGELIAGYTAGNGGSIVVSGGTLSTEQNIRLGGNSSTGVDTGSFGSLTVSGTGTVNIGDGSGTDRLWLAMDGNADLIVDGGGTLNVDDDVNIGSSTADTSTGTINITNGGTMNVLTGQIRAGLTTNGTGIINVVDGNLNVGEEIFLGGDSNAGVDDGANGELHIGSSGVVTVNAGGSANENVEVGRDGTGTLTVHGGTLDIQRGNLVMGQTAVSGAVQNSRGTLEISAGTINVGTAQSTGVNDLNFNEGGGDLTQTGGTVNIERNLNMASTGSAASSSYTISGGGTLNVGNNLNAGSSATGSNSFTVVGDSVTGGVSDTDVNITNLNFFQASQTLEFDFAARGDITDFNFDVSNNASFGAGLGKVEFSNVSGLATFYGDIELINIAGSQSGFFSGLAEGTLISGTSYQISYSFGDGNDVGLIQAVPEPSAIALMGIFAIGIASRRRRRT